MMANIAGSSSVRADLQGPSDGYAMVLLSKDEDTRNDPAPGSESLYTRQEERIVIKKLDQQLVLFMAFLYLLSFLGSWINCSLTSCCL